nr:helix-turn-helix domain-containing protein [uncultured Clostridium sp.]
MQREELGLKQKEMAEKLKLPANTYNGYETGKRQPSLEVVAEISNILEVSTDYLLGRSNIKNPQCSTYKKTEQHLTDDEKNILNLYKKLNDKDKAKVEGIMENKIDEYKTDKKIISSTCQNIEDIS